MTPLCNEPLRQYRSVLTMKQQAAFAEQSGKRQASMKVSISWPTVYSVCLLRVYHGNFSDTVNQVLKFHAQFNFVSFAEGPNMQLIKMPRNCKFYIDNNMRNEVPAKLTCFKV